MAQLFDHPNSKSPPVDPPSGGGHDGGMESRVTALETKWESVVPTLATKTDLLENKSVLSKDISDLRAEMHKGFSDQVKWIVGVAFAGLAALISVNTFILNSAAKQAAAPQAPAPIVITVPQPVAPAASR